MGPTPLSKLKIEGSVDGKDDTNNILILKIDDMVAPPKSPTSDRLTTVLLSGIYERHLR